MQKYEDWSKVLIEPQTLNYARLYALETRLHEEEGLRMKEFHLLKEHLMRLFFTLEQSNLLGEELRKEFQQVLDQTINEQRSMLNQSLMQSLSNTSTKFPEIKKGKPTEPAEQSPEMLARSVSLDLSLNESLSTLLDNKNQSNSVYKKRINYLKNQLEGTQCTGTSARKMNTLM